MWAYNINHLQFCIVTAVLHADKTIEGPSGGSRAAAVADGCREVVQLSSSATCDCSPSACISATTIPVARLVDIWPPVYILLSGGSARPLGYPRAETPTWEGPTDPIYRDCLCMEGLPLGEREWGQTRAQPAQPTPTRILLRPQLAVPQTYQAEETSPPTGRCRWVQRGCPVLRYVHASEYMDTP